MDEVGNKLRNFLKSLETEYGTEFVKTAVAREHGIYKYTKKTEKLKDFFSKSHPEAIPLLDMITIVTSKSSESNEMYFYTTEVLFGDEIKYECRIFSYRHKTLDITTWYFQINSEKYSMVDSEYEPAEVLLKVMQFLRITDVTVGTFIDILSYMNAEHLDLDIPDEKREEYIPCQLKSANSCAP